MRMLPLDDPRWKDLDHRGWSCGHRSKLDPTAPFVPDALRALSEKPSDHTRFQELWPYLCSEGTAWPAAYAAVPYIVEIAQKLQPAERFEYLYVIGLIRMSEAVESGDSALRTSVAASYREALPRALALVAELVPHPHDASTTRYLLAAIASLKGHTDLARILNELDTFAECPECSVQVFEYRE